MDRSRAALSAGSAIAMVVVLITFCASLLGSAAQTTIGFGSALFLSPVMFLILGPEQAVVCTLAVVTWVSVIMLAAERRDLALDRGVSLGLIGPAVPGVVGGALVVGVIDKAYLQIVVGAVVVVAVALQLRASAGEQARSGPGFGFRASALPAGLTAGVLNGAVSTGGPPLAIWLRSRGATPGQLRHTLAVAFVVINLASIVAVGALDSPEIDGEWLRALAGGLIGLPLGYWLGGRVLDRIDERTFGRAVSAGLLVVAGASIASGLGGL